MEVEDIEFKVRAGDADVDPDDAQESEPQFATVEGDNVPDDQASAVGFGAGLGTNLTLTDWNIAPATDEDWIYLDLAGGERVTLRVRTESLAIPSALDPAITVYDVDGNVVEANDDRDVGTVESELIFVPAVPGQYFIQLASSGNSSAGHYVLTGRHPNARHHRRGDNPGRMGSCPADPNRVQCRHDRQCHHLRHERRHERVCRAGGPGRYTADRQYRFRMVSFRQRQQQDARRQ